MRFRLRTGLLFCGVLLLAGIFLWRMTERPQVGVARPSAAPATPVAVASKPVALSVTAIKAASRAAKPPTSVTNRLAYRLTNTTKTVNQLARSERAILLEN